MEELYEATFICSEQVSEWEALSGHVLVFVWERGWDFALGCG